MSNLDPVQVSLSERLANARLQHQKQQAALATTARSRSKPSHDRASAAQNKAHQPLSCIIDDSALLAGLQEKDGLKQWVRNGAINLFVPLYTLEKLDSQRTSSPPSNNDARLALQWLDEITTATANKTAGFVQLQGPDDQYMSWQEVERYLLPETPLSAHDGHESLDGLNEAFAKSLETRMSNRLSTEIDNEETSFKSGSQPSTPASGEEKRGKKHADKRVRENLRICDRGKQFTDHASRTAAIPTRFRPLLNFVVWRTYHFDLSTSSAGTYVLLTNDSTTQKLAQKFGVRAKMLTQVRTIVAKEGTNNPQEEGLHGSEEDTTQDAAGEDDMIDAVGDMRAVDERDEDEVIYVPPSSNQPLQENIKTTVIDPNHFGRNTTHVTLAAPGLSPPSGPSTSPPKSSLPSKFAGSQPRARSQPSSPNPAKRTPANTNRHSNSHAQSRTASRGASSNNVGGGSMRGLGRQTVVPVPLPQVPRLVKPIDPDSYARPSPIGAPGGRGGRGGGGGSRRLWEP